MKGKPLLSGSCGIQTWDFLETLPPHRGELLELPRALEHPRLKPSVTFPGLFQLRASRPSLQGGSPPGPGSSNSYVNPHLPTSPAHALYSLENLKQSAVLCYHSFFLGTFSQMLPLFPYRHPFTKSAVTCPSRSEPTSHFLGEFFPEP